jgi:prevent-host-death family protein
MTRFAATEAKNRFGEVLEAAHREPVEISKKGRTVAVLLSVEAYTEMKDQLAHLSKPTDFSALRSWRKTVVPLANGKALDTNDYQKHLDEKFGQ